MAHFAKLDENSVVVGVHSVQNDVITKNNKEVEQLGIDFLTSLHGHSNWKQTSYNGTFRKNYAGIGYIYDANRDAFIAPKPNCHEEIFFDEQTCQWNCLNENHIPSL